MMSKIEFFAAFLLIARCVTGPASAEQTQPIANMCLARDVQATAAIEKLGKAQELPSRGLYGAALAIQRARSACREGQVDEAIALYELVLALEPVEVCQSELHLDP